jgi:aminoglycoside 6-adenylyltransferase
MRTEKEMFDLILNNAKEKEYIRAVYMNGSRANPKAAKDKYQDFDIVYVVDETAPPFNDKQWIMPFGKIAVLQEPDLNDLARGETHDFTRSYGWLLLLYDGNRIDLSICTKEFMLEEYTKDSLTVPLLDKDGCLPPISDSNDSSYYVKKPTEGQYIDSTSDFWWCLQNVAKGIARDELTYAMNMYIQVVHEKLESMVKWYIGIHNDFSLNLGMWGKYFKKYLPENLYNMYVKTYSDANYENLWNAIFTACELFRIIAPVVGNYFGYVYNKQEDENMTEYLVKVQNSIYCN